MVAVRKTKCKKNQREMDCSSMGQAASCWDSVLGWGGGLLGELLNRALSNCVSVVLVKPKC